MDEKKLDPHLEKLFLKALENDSEQEVHRAIAQGMDVNQVYLFSDGATFGTPLMIAAKKKKPASVRMLLEAGADPNLSTSGGWTALHFVTVTTLPDIRCADVLLNAGACPETTATISQITVRSPLYMAVRMDHDMLLERFINAGATPRLIHLRASVEHHGVGLCAKRLLSIVPFSSITDILNEDPTPLDPEYLVELRKAIAHHEQIKLSKALLPSHQESSCGALNKKRL